MNQLQQNSVHERPGISQSFALPHRSKTEKTIFSPPLHREKDGVLGAADYYCRKSRGDSFLRLERTKPRKPGLSKETKASKRFAKHSLWNPPTNLRNLSLPAVSPPERNRRPKGLGFKPAVPSEPQRKMPLKKAGAPHQTGAPAFCSL